MKGKVFISFLAALLVLALVAVLAPSAFVQGVEPEPDVLVYTYDELLPPGAPLTDGDVKKFKIDEYTWFTWVDLMPEAKFEHDTVYIFVSADGKVSAQAGKWWPELDGKIILYGWKPWEMKFPVDVHGFSGTVKVYAWPKLITPDDKLTDGGFTPIKITENTLLYWVDLHPGMRFTHPTAYILVSADDEVRIVQGGWWPELNGKPILYGQSETVLKFPFPVE
jgi:hypothetical protein